MLGKMPGDGGTSLCASCGDGDTNEISVELDQSGLKIQLLPQMQETLG